MIRYSSKKLLIASDEWDILYHRGVLYQYVKNENKYKKIIELYASGLKKVLSKVRLAERLLRLEPRTACKINKNEFAFSYDGKVVIYDLMTHQVENTHQCRKGMNNPLQLVKIEGVRGFEDCLLYGEYWGNEQGEDVCIYSYEKKQWQKKYVFEKGQIQHVHGFVKGMDCLYILTGDKDECSGIWCAKDNFLDVKPVLKGSQKYRACRGFEVDSGIVYATDTPLQENGLFFWDKKNFPKLIYKMPGPCIFATEIERRGEKYQIFATSVEPDSRYHGLKYLLTYKLGEGVQGRYSYLIAGNKDIGFKIIGKYKKDIMPMGLFQFGNIWFPDNYTDNLYLVFQSICGKDGITYEYCMDSIIDNNEYGEEDGNKQNVSK